MTPRPVTQHRPCSCLMGLWRTRVTDDIARLTGCSSPVLASFQPLSQRLGPAPDWLLVPLAPLKERG